MTENTNSPIDQEFLVQLRRMGTVEGISTLLLFFVAMPLKYWAGVSAAVSIAGTIHGVLFLIFGAMCALAVQRVPLTRVLGLTGILAAVVPFGPFIFDRRLAAIADAAPSSGSHPTR